MLLQQLLFIFSLNINTMKDIKGKNAFVTGSSRGVGQQIALGLAKIGCNVILHGRNH
jgi:short-subunit dehydrogenase